MAVFGFLVALVFLIPTAGLSLLIYFAALIAFGVMKANARAEEADRREVERNAQASHRVYSAPVARVAAPAVQKPSAVKTSTFSAVAAEEPISIEDLVLESARKESDPVQRKGITEMQVEVFFLTYFNAFPIEHRIHALGSARCGWLMIGDGVFCVGIFVVGDNVVVQSSEKIAAFDFVMHKDRRRHEFISIQKEVFEASWAMIQKEGLLAA